MANTVEGTDQEGLVGQAWAQVQEIASNLQERASESRTAFDAAGQTY
jgi:hypothetical protein